MPNIKEIAEKYIEEAEYIFEGDKRVFDMVLKQFSRHLSQYYELVERKVEKKVCCDFCSAGMFRENDICEHKCHQPRQCEHEDIKEIWWCQACQKLHCVYTAITLIKKL